MKRTQFRVSWTREANDLLEGEYHQVFRFTKHKTFYSRASAEQFRALIESPEPWTAFREFAGKDPDEEWACCDGHNCGCGGATIREHFMSRRETLPPLVGPVTISTRTVTTSKWEPIE